MTASLRPHGEDDPGTLVRAIGRMAHMVIELRDEYVATPRDDTLDQLERRLDELQDLRQQLQRARTDAPDAAQAGSIR